MKITKILFAVIFFVSVYPTAATTFHIDPEKGSNSGDGSYSSPWKTLQYVVNHNLIESMSYVTPYNPANPKLIAKNEGAPVKPGDTLLLYSGFHGEVFLRNYINTGFITIMAAPEAIPVIKKIRLQAARKWRIQGLTISSEPYGEYIKNNLVFLESHNWHGPLTQIEVKYCHIYSTSSPWTKASDWVQKASNGIIISGDSISIRNNVLENIRFGISMLGNYINVSNNIVRNFSGDGIRLLGSHDLVESNYIANCYDVDENHDDGIQSFTTGGLTVDDNIIRQNIILNYEDPAQPLLGPLQGIGCFDGPYRNWLVENNLVVVNHWHGISLYGAINCKIINNTVLDPTPAAKPGPSWIRIDSSAKTPSRNCIVKNNAVNTIAVNSSTITGNNALLKSPADYSKNFTDYKNHNYHLLPTSILIDAADNGIAPAVDLEGNHRPSGKGADIGAYEFQQTAFVNSDGQKIKINIYPNPADTYLQINSDNILVNINIFDLAGKTIARYSNIILPEKIDISSLQTGTYILQVTNNHNSLIKTFVFIKNGL